MKTILSLRRCHGMEGVVTLFLVAAFMAGMVGCMGDGGGGGVEYTLDISSTDGGEVVNPGEGTFTHAAGYALLLGASPDPGFHFVSWSGDVSTIGDANSFVTNIRMNGDYSIVAKFEPGPQYSPGVAAGTFHTVGLQKCPILLPEVFSTPISDSRRDYGQCNLGGWTDIIQVAAGSAQLSYSGALRQRDGGRHRDDKSQFRLWAVRCR
jgi:hypothetical protein